MELRFVPVTRVNREAVLALRVAPGQEGFIESTRDCLAEADGLPDYWRPVGIYDGETLVGFAMYGQFPQHEDGSGEKRVWLDRLLIDARYQGRGYGEESLRALLARLQGEYGCGEIFLSLYDGNVRARALYEKYGFGPNGERDRGGETVMVRRNEG